jgi:hypothetical protein
LRSNSARTIYLSDGKTHDTKVLDMLVFEPGAFYVMDRGYMDFKRLYRLHQAGAFYVTRAKDNLRARRVYSAPTDRSTGVIADQRVMLEGFYAIQDYPEHMRRIRFNDPTTGQTLIFLTNNTSLACHHHRSPVQKPLAGQALLQMDQAAPAHQALFGYERECCEDPDLVRSVYLCADRDHQKGVATQGLALHLSTDSFSMHIRENRALMRLAAK